MVELFNMTNELKSLKEFAFTVTSDFLAEKALSDKKVYSVNIEVPINLKVKIRLVFNTLMINRGTIMELPARLNTQVREKTEGGMELRLLNVEYTSEIVLLENVPPFERGAWSWEGNLAQPKVGENGITLTLKLLKGR